MLNARQARAVALMAEGSMSNIAVAKEVKVSENTIYNWLNNEEFLSELQKAQKRMFTKVATKAQHRMIELLDSENQNVAFNAAREILNKAGLDAPLQIDADVRSQVIFEGESDLED